jgi:hypothetical protein
MSATNPPGVAGKYDPILGIPISPIVVAGRPATIYVEFDGKADGTSCYFYYLRIAGATTRAGKVSVGFKDSVPGSPQQVTPPVGATSTIVTLPTLSTDVGTMVVFGRNAADPPGAWIALCTFLVQA